MRFSCGTAPAVLALLLLTSGCQDSASDSSETTTTPARSAADTGTKTSPRATHDSETVAEKPSKSKSPKEKSDKGAKQTAKKSAASQPFEPPFAHRIDLFAPPTRSGNKIVKNEEHDATIELHGFVDVDGVRAVLAIDGLVAPIAEGEERFGIQVITIQPPIVVLQRGRQRWTATLEK